MSRSTNVMKGNFKLSRTIPCSKAFIALSPDGRLFATELNPHIVISSCSTLKPVVSVLQYGSIAFAQFSPDSQYLSWLCVSSNTMKLFEIGTESSLEIDVKRGLALISTIWGKNCLLYVSELEIFVGVYDLTLHCSFTLEGCSVNEFDLPLLTFSPLNDYLCFTRGHKMIVYDCHRWELKVAFNCSNFVKPLFVSPYVLFLASVEGTVDWVSIYGLKIKTSHLGASGNIVDAILSEDNRSLFASTWDNNVIMFDVLSMEQKRKWKYIFDLKTVPNVKVFVATSEIVNVDGVKFENFELSEAILIKELKNVLDEFKLKTKVPHLMALKSQSHLLATFNPAMALTVWIWKISHRNPLKSVVRLNDSAGKVLKLQWHSNFNELAIICSNLVVIWKEADKLVSIRGENIDFKWLDEPISIGAVTFSKVCRFVYFVDT